MGEERENSNGNKVVKQSLPNIIFIFPDQLRADFLGCYGGEMVETPNIDALAREGIRYERAYSGSPLCVPARASLLVGINAVKTGVLDNSRFIRPDYRETGLRTWPELLADKGYKTCAVGKMHFYPWDIDMGFEERVIAEDKRWSGIKDDYHDFLKEKNLSKFHAREYENYSDNKGAVFHNFPPEYTVDHFVGMESVKKIMKHDGSAPLAMMVGFPGPHCPYDPNREFVEMVNRDKIPAPIPKKNNVVPVTVKNRYIANAKPWNGIDYSDATEEQYINVRSHYAALVKQLDEEVGSIVNALKKKKIWDNTVVIFSSDHGDFLGDHGMVGKGTFLESAVRVPLIINTPQTRKTSKGERPLTNNSLVSLGDITATILSLAGCKVPEYMDSEIIPHMGSKIREREHILGMTSAGWMIQRDNLRLAVYVNGDKTLFDLSKDPKELDNLADKPEYAAEKAELFRIMSEEFIASVDFAHREKKIYTTPPTEDPLFGERGWKRTYPFPL